MTETNKAYDLQAKILLPEKGKHQSQKKKTVDETKNQKKTSFIIKLNKRVKL